MCRGPGKKTVWGCRIVSWLTGAALVGCTDDTPRLTESSEREPPAFLTAATAALAFNQVSAGGLHSCGITTENRVYCWGFNGSGQLGDGTTTDKSSPVPVIRPLQFRQLSAGFEHSCGVTTNYQAYCWGQNNSGQLGDGTSTRRVKPVLVHGGLQFRQVAAGRQHTCGVAYSSGRVYCWGYGYYGQLGDGTAAEHLKPSPVAGDRRFRQVSAGDWHSCAVTTGDKAFCWGWNRNGRIGDGTLGGRRLRPVLVAGGHLFSEVSAARAHSCGVTTDRTAYCWGANDSGQVGDGTTSQQLVPSAVAGGLSFRRVSAGAGHACGETAANLAYCWGGNLYGQLGDGTSAPHLVPGLVARGLAISQLSTGARHTCGRTPAAVAYCWGSNEYGQLGDGTTTDQSTPMPVAGPT